MKLHILSDLHLEFEDFALPDTHADVIVLAGDTSVGTRGIGWANKKSGNKPVIYIAGNHEFYRHAYPKLLDDLNLKSKNSNVHFLENGIFISGNVRILACTLWTDFQLYGQVEYAMFSAGMAMNDYKLIRRSPNYSKLKAMDTALIHAKSLNWLTEQLSINQGKTVVVTHHAPSVKSIPTAYAGDAINPAFASNLENLILEFQPELWIHGHIHTACDYRIGKTRVICNPRGYPLELNTGFIPDLVVEI